MSTGWASIPVALLHDQAVPRDAKLTYLVLSSHVEKDGTMIVTQQQLAAEAGMSLTHVKRQLRWLRDNGFVQWETRTDPDNLKVLLPNVYRLSGYAVGPVRPDLGPVVPNPLGPEVPSKYLRTKSLTTKDLLLTADAESETPRPKTILNRREMEMFGQWWQEWPRKVARAAAEVAFKKALSNVAFQDLMNATRRYRDDPNREQQFTPYPATWLNRGQWTDEPEPPRTSGRAPASPPDRQMIPNEAGRMVPDPYDNWMNQ